MEIIKITSIEQYLSYAQISYEESDIFRGIGNDEDFKFIPSAGRFGIKDIKTQTEFEQKMLEDFKRKSPLYLSSLPKNDFEWLILAQHHGLPTRLMDWTYNPLVGLYFAVDNEYQKDCAIYHSYHNKMVTPEIQDTWSSPYAINFIMHIIPNLNHERYRNQNGLFSIHPNPGEEDFTQITKKYLIPLKYKQNIRWKLRKMGITKSLLFPSLDSVAYDIKHKVFKNYEPYFNK